MNTSLSCTQQQFQHLHVALQRFVLQVVYEHFHGSTEDLSFDHLEYVRHFLLNSKTGKTIRFGTNIALHNIYHTITFQPAKTEKKQPSSTKQLLIPGKTVWNRFTIITKINGEGQCTIAYDHPKKLFVRLWKPGDTFIPLGMRGKKKVQDFFTDTKIPQQQRQELPIIVDEEDTIIAVYNLRIDDRVKVNPHTKQTLTLTISP
jgi:tRNA(Ile)-lysidine synthase